VRCRLRNICACAQLDRLYAAQLRQRRDRFKRSASALPESWRRPNRASGWGALATVPSVGATLQLPAALHDNTEPHAASGGAGPSAQLQSRAVKFADAPWQRAVTHSTAAGSTSVSSSEGSGGGGGGGGGTELTGGVVHVQAPGLHAHAQLDAASPKRSSMSANVDAEVGAAEQLHETGSAARVTLDGAPATLPSLIDDLLLDVPLTQFLRLDAPSAEHASRLAEGLAINWTYDFGTGDAEVRTCASVYGAANRRSSCFRSGSPLSDMDSIQQALMRLHVLYAGVTAPALLLSCGAYLQEYIRTHRPPHTLAQLQSTGAAGVGSAGAHAQHAANARGVRSTAATCREVSLQVRAQAQGCRDLGAQLQQAARVLERMRLECTLRWQEAQGQEVHAPELEQPASALANLRGRRLLAGDDIA
jgi:hypothetical protein